MLIKQAIYGKIEIEMGELVNVDKILKSVLKRQIPFLIGGTVSGTIMTLLTNTIGNLQG
jgi:hypothetical protein